MQLISVIEICTAFRQDNLNDRRVPMQSWWQEKVKKRYDNLYARMLFKEMANPKLLPENVLDNTECRKLTNVCKTRNVRDYRSSCYPWLTVMRPGIQRIVRGKMKRKHYCSQNIDGRDFLAKYTWIWILFLDKQWGNWC